MNRLIILLLIFLSVQTNGQIKKTRTIAWIIPSAHTRINGFAVGLLINSLKDFDSTFTSEINGIGVELIGAGLFLPLAPSSPIYSKPKEFYLNNDKLDSIVRLYNHAKYKINGLAISSGGIGGHDININGLNLSGINTLTGKLNGLSVCILINISGVVNGVSIGGLVNNSIQSKGLQIGLFNTTTRLRGFQIGLWNRNEKRALPLINWSFN